LALGGLLVFLAWQIAQIGWWVEWGGLKINAAVLGLTPPILMGSTIIYAMDGVRAARAYLGVVATSAIFSIVFLEFLGGLSAFVPMPHIFYLSLQHQGALTAAYLLSIFSAIIILEGVQRLMPPVAMAVGFTAGMAVFLLSFSFISYGITIGVTNIGNEYAEYCLASLPIVGMLLVYGAFARRFKLIMPARPVSSILNVWKSTESEISEAREGIVEAHNVIAELRSLNRQLETEQKLRVHQVKNSPLAILDVDRRGRVTRFNAAAQNLLGTGVSLGQPISVGVAAEKFIPGFSQFFAEPDGPSRTVHVGGSDESTKAIHVTVMPVRRGKKLHGFSVLAEDITERVRKRQKRTITERVRGIHMTGQVISHDYSNLLTAIESNLAYVRNRLEKEMDGELKGALKAIADASHHGREMLAQLGSGQIFHHPELKAHRLSELVAEAIRMQLPAARQAGVTFHTSVGKDVVVDIDTTQILRVFINLLGNAIRATQDGGAINIRCKKREAGALLEIVDHGIGMSQRQVAAAFDPGFSTKGKGQGGLGLAIAFLIVDAHGGRLILESEPGMGTTVGIWLPLAEHTVASPRATAPKGIVLWLPDDRMRTPLANYFGDLGFEVAEIDNEDELMAIFDDDPEQWKLLIRRADVPLSPEANQLARQCGEIVVPNTPNSEPIVRNSGENQLPDRVLDGALAWINGPSPASRDAQVG
jgi:signal transduction histidine kinase